MARPESPPFPCGSLPHTLLFFNYIYLFISVLHRYAHAMAHVEVKGQFLRVISLLPPGRVWESDSGCQAWQQVLLSAKLCWWPENVFSF